ncbi:NifB/NifX family molybdenum-iron cluster-binding protein [Desulfothermobacter acidiphilus]|uniref:NifB/NifX family molybdenum-iron cluster-binding protein n=1 Tax=Desulfothermobacter acidiphilus TaxID=1938353 RepID=UPI003F8B3C0F
MAKDTCIKIAVSAKGNRPDSLVEPNFGEAEYYLIFDAETKGYQAFPHPAKGEPEAGIKAVELLKEQGAKVIVTGNLGPNAFQAIAAAGMECRIGAGGTVQEAIDAYFQGKLSKGTYPGGGICPGSDR